MSDSVTRPYVRCGHCRGTGVVLVGDHLHATLNAIGGGACTIPAIHKRLLRSEPNLKVTAVNNRVRELERLGLVVKGPRVDRAFTWTVTRLVRMPRAQPRGDRDRRDRSDRHGGHGGVAMSAHTDPCACDSCRKPDAVIYGSETWSIDVRPDGYVTEHFRSGKTIGYSAEAWAAEQRSRRAFQDAVGALSTREYKP